MVSAPEDTAVDEKRQPFVEHLRELRVCLRNSVIAMVIAMAATFSFSQRIYDWLMAPLYAAARARHLEGKFLHFAGVTEPFWVYLEVSIYAAVFVASPVIFHQLWRFIAPGLYARERRFGLLFALFSAVFFVGGAAFCYLLVFPAAFQFLLGYVSASIEPSLMMRPQLDFAVNMLLAFGLVFELPLLIFFLSWAGIVTHRGLLRFNKYAMVLSFIVGAVLTPGPDIVSQLLMAAPMILLYNLSILIAWVVTRRRAGHSRAGTSFQK